ncbi:Predicted PurR-regulated permease PerM [Aromatoleum tolulyticum]|uniref:Predicted PurR-regulated permease PerM n=1 Tax=Aromatoleum tolulyticum TaxID=34027 RepID=A0A1N6XYJ7_9RHOO|nr:AI-2E family transporter [Aromatoleum tolulyticum]SIR07333.1 Predicted PurR-regulated permease PerM [Aromatoleum tolulyticum]
MTHSGDIPAAAPVKPEPQAGEGNGGAGAVVIPAAVADDTTAPTVDAGTDARGLALGILATVAVVFVLEWAQSFFISMLLGILFAYTLNPLVVWLERIRVPRVVGSVVVMVGVVCALGLGTFSLRGQMQTILDQVPEAVSKLSAGLTSLRKGEASTMQKVQTAASEIEKVTSQAAGMGAAPRQPTRVVVDSPGFKLGNFLLVGSMGAVGLIGQAAMVLFLTFFLLLSGDTYKRKLVRLTGPSISSKKITVHILDDINESIQRYMFMLLATNVLVAMLTWITLHWVGLDNAGAWAVAAGLLHVIPYFGPAVAAAGIGMAAFMQFDVLSTALLVAGASVAIATFVGTFVTTWMTGRIARMNTAAVFVSLLFWAWLWGVWGLLLSIPITVIVKVVTQHVEQLESVAELLGE